MIKQIIKNLFSSWGLVGLQVAIGLFLVPFLLDHLGKEGFGVIGLLMTIIGFAGIADLGLRQALNRELSEKVAKKDQQGFRRLSSSALVLYVLIALIIGAVGAFFAPAICSLFKIGDDYLGIMTLLLSTYAPLSVLISFVTPVFTAGICSFMRYDVQNNISMFAQLCISLMLFACLTLLDGNPLIIWCSVKGAGALIRLSVMGHFYRKVCYGGRLGFRYVHLDSLIPLFKLGGSMYVLQLTRVLAQRMDPLIISRFLGLGAVALYQAGSRLPQMVNPIILAAVNQLTPLTTKFHVTHNQAREHQILILGTKYTLYLGAFFSAGMILFADSFCHLWLFDTLGNDVKTVALVLKLWAAANLFNYAGGAHWPIVLGKKKIKFAVWLNVPPAIFNVILSVYLVGYTSLGIAGVLVGTVISEFTRRVISVWYMARITDVRLKTYLVDGYLPPVIFMMMIITPSYFVLNRLGEVAWLEFILFVSIFSIYSGLVFCVTDKEMVVQVFRKYLRN